MAIGLAVTRNGSVPFSGPEHANEARVTAIMQRAAVSWGYEGSLADNQAIAIFVLENLEQEILRRDHRQRLNEYEAAAPQPDDFG